MFGSADGYRPVSKESRIPAFDAPAPADACDLEEARVAAHQAYLIQDAVGASAFLDGSERGGSTALVS